MAIDGEVTMESSFCNVIQQVFSDDCMNVSRKSLSAKEKRCENIIRMKTPASRLAWLVEESGLSQGEFAHILDVTEQTLSSWVNGRRAPRRSNLRHLPKIFDLPLGILIRFIEKGEPLPQSAKVGAVGSNRTNSSQVARRPANWPPGKIPLVGRVPATNGGQGVSDYTETWAENFVDQGTRAGPNAQAFTVDGESMLRTVRPGEIVIADPDVEPQDGNLVVVQFHADRDENNCVKRFIRLTRDRFRLVSDDPNKHPAIEVRREEVAWMGTVVEARRGMI